MRWSFWIALLTGCYSPQPPQGAPCGDDNACPSGQLCFDGFCSINAPGLDATPPDPDSTVVPGDAPPDTLDPVPPFLRFGERADAINDTWFDTFLHSDEVTNNFGGHPDLHLTASEIDPVLLRIDVSTVPAHAKVTKAQLRFRVTSQAIVAGTVIEIFTMNESWTEGTGDHSAGIANFTTRNLDQAWSESGAKPPSRGATAVASHTANDTGEGDEIVIPLPNALVETWITSPDTNRGVALMVDAASFYCELGSSEFPNNDLRPVLELELE